LARARRVLDEMVVDGMATALPFHRAVIRDAAFTTEPFTVHTRWIETEFDNRIPAFVGGPDASEEPAERETVVVEVGGKRLEVALPADLAVGSRKTTGPARPKRSTAGKGGPAIGGAGLTSPMQGTIVKVAVAEGDVVAEGDLVVVLEAMKMEQPLLAHKAGTIKSLSATVGGVVTSGALICEIAD
jgi:acetyl-CoA/propionyl-CoA carboxylase biotin carboxyl carrier protein